MGGGQGPLANSLFPLKVSEGNGRNLLFSYVAGQSMLLFAIIFPFFFPNITVGSFFFFIPSLSLKLSHLMKHGSKNAPSPDHFSF